MNRTAPALLALLLASALAGQATVADPLHKYGDEGAWCHVDSGWLFPKDVGSFARASQPYNIDGNNDAGAEYRQAAGALAEVDVYAADSAATDASLDGAKATAARKAGEGARVASEKPFAVGSDDALKGLKISYASNVPGKQTNLYYFTTDKWRVKVLVSGPQGKEGSDEALDAFVQALPWKTLGTQSGIH